MIRNVPLPRLGNPEEPASAGSITEQVLFVDGGFTVFTGISGPISASRDRH